MHRIAVLFAALALACAADVTLHETSRAVDPSRVSVEAQAQELGKDPQKLFELVRDRVENDAYEGVLRGGRGTLLSLAGNSADKAILLRELLAASGCEARFAHGTLDTAAAARLADGVLQGRAAPSADKGESSPEMKAFVEAAQRESAEQAQALSKALVDGGFQAPEGTPCPDPSLLVDHWWVQWHNGDAWMYCSPGIKTH